MDEIIDKIFKEKYPKGLSYEYTKEEMTGYMCAINDIKEQLPIYSVVKSLPTKQDFISELEQHQEKWSKAHNEDSNNTYALGFRHCFHFLNDRIKLK